MPNTIRGIVLDTSFFGLIFENWEMLVERQFRKRIWRSKAFAEIREEIKTRDRRDAETGLRTGNAESRRNIYSVDDVVDLVK